MTDEWRTQGACSTGNLSPEDLNAIFFPNDPRNNNGLSARYKARSICVNCPVYDQCVTWALEHYQEIPFGTFAGLDENQRNNIDCGLERYRDWRPAFPQEKLIEIQARRLERPRAAVDPVKAEERRLARRKPSGRPAMSPEAHQRALEENRERRQSEAAARAARRKQSVPVCPYCHSNEKVNRWGRNSRGEPRIICYGCNRRSIVELAS